MQAFVKTKNPPFNSIRQISKELLVNKDLREKIQDAIDGLMKLSLHTIAEKVDHCVQTMKETKMKGDMLEESVNLKLKIMNEKLDKLSLGSKE